MLTTQNNSDKPTQAKIAVVIPVYRHSVLVAEAITCALAQRQQIPYVIIIVNDGCKFAESDRVCWRFCPNISPTSFLSLSP